MTRDREVLEAYEQKVLSLKAKLAEVRRELRSERQRMSLLIAENEELLRRNKELEKAKNNALSFRVAAEKEVVDLRMEKADRAIEMRAVKAELARLIAGAAREGVYVPSYGQVIQPKWTDGFPGGIAGQLH